MRMSGPAFDTAHMLRPLLLVFSALALVGLIALAVRDDSQDSQLTQPNRVKPVVACLQKLGYSTSVYHDDGREPLVGPDSDPDIKVLFGDATRQARPPSNQVSASLPSGVVVNVTVPDGGGTSRTEFSYGVPRTARQRAALADCANP